MKLKIELIKKILDRIEADNSWPAPIQNIAIEGYEQIDVVYHLFLMSDADLIRITDCTTRAGKDCLVKEMTWEGHAFLANSKDPTNWKKFKGAMNTIGDVSFDVAKATLASMAGAAVAVGIQSLH